MGSTRRLSTKNAGDDLVRRRSIPKASRRRIRRIGFADEKCAKYGVSKISAGFPVLDPSRTPSLSLAIAGFRPHLWPIG